LTKIRSGYFHHLGTDGVAHAEDRAQDVGQPLLAIEAKQHTRGAGEHSFSHQQTRLRRCTFWIRQLKVRRVVQRIAVG
jgi:hypothetical protein